MTDWYADLTDRENDGVPELRPNTVLQFRLAAGERMSDIAMRQAQSPSTSIQDVIAGAVSKISYPGKGLK